jgi:hypothetical protein
MEPKEKAKELLDKYLNPFNRKGCIPPNETTFKSTAKQYVLITVNEMLKEPRMFDSEQVKCSNESYSRSYYEVPNKFWQQVKQEIEKL